MKTFLLRFEERIVQSWPSPTRRCPPSLRRHPEGAAREPRGGPKTITEVRAEGADADPGSLSFHAFRK